MTTHRERIQAALQGELIDRAPVALWRHFPVDDQGPGLPLWRAMLSLVSPKA